MLHLLSFVLAALVASKALAAPIEASAAADAEHLPTAPEWSVSGSIAARQLPSGLPIVGGLGSLLGNLPRAVGDGNLELDNLNIPLPGDSAPALKMRQGGPLVPVAPSPPRLPLPLSFVPTDGAAATGTQEIGAGGGGGGGGGISFPAVLRRQFEGILNPVGEPSTGTEEIGAGGGGGGGGGIAFPSILRRQLEGIFNPVGEPSTGTEEIGAGGGGGGGGGIAFPSILRREPTDEFVAEDAFWPVRGPSIPVWSIDGVDYDSWSSRPTPIAEDVAVPTVSELYNAPAEITAAPVAARAEPWEQWGDWSTWSTQWDNHARAATETEATSEAAPTPTAAPTAASSPASWEQWTDWTTWTTQWGQFGGATNGGNNAGANAWPQTWDGAAYTNGWNQPAVPTAPAPAAASPMITRGVVLPRGAAAAASAAVHMPPMDVSAEVGKGTVKAGAASPAKITAGTSL